MASVPSISSANQYGWQQLKLQQAKRNADQAEQNALSLRTQASDAQRVADRAQETARTLSVQSEQAQRKAGQARQGLAAVNTAQQAVSQLSKFADQVLVREQASTTTTQSTSTPSVTNNQGQVTGTIINTTA